MSRRDFRTPPNVPSENVGRCIVIPNDAAWLGLLNAALLMLTEHWRYDQVEPSDLTPEETAALWYGIYVSTLSSSCEDCPDMNCDDVLQCIIDAGFSLSLPSLPSDQRVIDGVPQVSFDGGTTWVDVFGDAGAAPIVKAPSATIGANDEAKICLASTRAALVLAEFYKQTFGAFTADITNALGTFNNFLQELNSALLGLAYGQAAQMLNAEIMRGQDWETNYTAAELSSGALDDLLCLLVRFATVDAGGVVTFDYGAVRDNVIADVGINPGTALWFLLGNMQQAGLNAAGSVHITDTAMDCGDCDGVWCYTWATPPDCLAGDWVRDFGACDGNGYWVDAQNGNFYLLRATLDVDLGASVVTRFDCDFANVGGTNSLLQVNANTVASFGSVTSGWRGVDVNVTGLAQFRVYLDRPSAGNTIIGQFRLSGTGTNPFGADNC